MVELLKKYKGALIVLILILINLTWYIVQGVKGKNMALKLSTPHYETQFSEGTREDMASLQDEMKPDSIVVAAPKEELNEAAYKASVQVPVYICGEIIQPGVYYVESESILNDVIVLSGGFTADADKNYLNLAGRVISNQKIYVPKVGEEIDKYLNSYDNGESLFSQETALGSYNSLSQEYSKMININTASEKELQTLSGIGEVKARAIIAYRNSIGKFKRIEELLNVSGIGDKTFEKIRAFVTV